MKKHTITKKIHQSDHHHDYDSEYYRHRGGIMAECHGTNILDHLFKKYKTVTILDVGCGAGSLMRLLKKKGFNRVKGIDISPVAAKLSGGRVASATKIPYKSNSFDCVIGLSVIEHLSKEEGNQFLRQAFRVLKPGGFIFLLTPNGASPLRVIKGKKWYGYDDHSHTFFFTPWSLKSSIHNAKFTRIRRTFKVTIDTNDWPLPVLNRLPAPVRRWINVLWISTPLAFFRDSIFVSGEKPTSSVSR